MFSPRKFSEAVIALFLLICLVYFRNWVVTNKTSKRVVQDARYAVQTKAASIYFAQYPQDVTLYLSRQSIRNQIKDQNNRRLTYLLKVFGPEKIIKRLFDESWTAKGANCHVNSHYIGRLSYKIFGDQALSKYITLCSSGYMHSVILELVVEHGVKNLDVYISKTCEKYNTDFQKLTCYHGSGHGVMAYFDYDLPKAINTCKKFDSDFKRSNCLVGVFMENIGTESHDSAEVHTSSWLDPKDPQFPCNKVDQDPQVQEACYAMQPSWISNIYKDNLDKVAQECLKVEAPYIPSCIYGYGELAASYVISQPKKIIAYCKKVPNIVNYSIACLKGAQAVIMDFWGINMTSQQGKDFCNLTPIDYKNICQNIFSDRLRDISKR